MTGLLLSQPGALRPLRAHQERAIEALRRSLAAGKRRPMLQAPTGAGKTLTAAHIIQRALEKGRRIALTVPALSLIDQTIATFEGEGIECVGVIQGVHPRTDREQPVQICSIGTLSRRKRPDVDLGSGLIDHSQRMTAAAMQIAEK
jgi:DNA repair protein RadD